MVVAKTQPIKDIDTKDGLLKKKNQINSTQKTFMIQPNVIYVKQRVSLK